MVIFLDQGLLLLIISKKIKQTFQSFDHLFALTLTTLHLQFLLIQKHLNKPLMCLIIFLGWWNFRPPTMAMLAGMREMTCSMAASLYRNILSKSWHFSHICASSDSRKKSSLRCPYAFSSDALTVLV